MDDLVSLVKQICDGDIEPWEVVALDLPDRVLRDLGALVAYELRYRHEHSPEHVAAERRARRLLRSLVTPRQWREYRSSLVIKVKGSAGGMYRLCPQTGAVQGLALWKGRWHAVTSYCIHHATSEDLPAADSTVSQLLLLTCDEPAFLATANAQPFWSAMARFLQRQMVMTSIPICEEEAA